VLEYCNILYREITCIELMPCFIYRYGIAVCSLNEAMHARNAMREAGLRLEAGYLLNVHSVKCSSRSVS
jgi:hypothetical protein